MTDLKDLIEREIDQYLEWPTADKSHVTTVSAKLFAEHVARLYADHIPDAGKMVADQLRGGTKKIGRPQIREVFLRNGFTIKPDRDDLRDYVYEAAFELLEMGAPAVQGEPVAYAVFEDNGNIRIWCADPIQAETLRQQYGGALQPLYTATQPTPSVQGEPVELSADMARLYDVIGLRRSQPVSTLIANIENIKRFSGYLWAVEREFFMVPGEPDEDYPDEYPEPACLLSCFPAESTAAYVEQFRKALKGVTAQQPAEQKPFEWPLLDAPALIGGAVVGKGCSTGTVVAIAKRAYQYAVETSPEEHARREKAFKDTLRQIHEGIGQQPAEQCCEYCDGTGDVHSLDGEWRGTCDCPAGQQPEPISRNLRAVHAMILNALDRDAAEGKAVRGEMAAELRSAIAEQQPSPDVARLVGALEQIASGSHGGRYEVEQLKRIASASLAAHRKGGGQ